MRRAILLGLILATVGRAADDAVDPTVVMDRWIRGFCDASAFNTISSMTLRDTITDFGGKPHDFVATFGGGGTYRLETVGAPEGRVFTCDGKTGWEKSETLGFGRSNREAILDVYRFHNPFYPVSLRNKYESAVWGPDEVYDGLQCRTCKMKPKGGGLVVETWTIEADTGRVRKISVGTGELLRVLTFDDYRSVVVDSAQSVTFPFRVSATYGEKTLVVQRNAFEVGGVKPKALFEADPTDIAENAKASGILDRYALLGRTVSQGTELHTRKLVETITTAAAGISTRRTVVLKKSPIRILIDDVTVGMGENVEGFDGKAGWALSDILGFRPLKPEESSQLLVGVFPEADRSLPASAPLRKWIGDRIVDEKRAVAVGLANQFFALGVFYFDAEDGHLLRVAYSKKPYARIPETTIDYADYKSVDGIDIAFTSVFTTATAQSVVSIESINNNVEVDDALFLQRKKFNRETPVAAPPKS